MQMDVLLCKDMLAMALTTRASFRKLRPGLSEKQATSVYQRWWSRFEQEMTRGYTTEKWAAEFRSKLEGGLILLNWF
jgi:hypothetical protein